MRNKIKPKKPRATKPFTIEITKKNGFLTINDAIGYFPKKRKNPDEWLFVIEKANGDRCMINRDIIEEIYTFEGEDEND